MSRRLLSHKGVRFHFLPVLTFLLVVSLLFYAPLMADEKEWEPVYEVGGINVQKRDVAKSKFLEFKAIGNLRGSISEYISVLFDMDKLPDWAPLCLEAQYIERINDREAIIYVVCNGIWPVADRDYIARLTLISDTDIKNVRVDVKRVDHPEKPDITGRIRIPHLQCSWVFERIDSLLTRVELRAHIDPGGKLPAWLVNWGYRKVPYRFMKGLESQVAKR